VPEPDISLTTADTRMRRRLARNFWQLVRVPNPKDSIRRELPEAANQLSSRLDNNQNRPRKTAMKFRSLFLLLLIGSVMLGCSGPAKNPMAGLPNTGKPALHAIQDKRLRELMDQMNSVVFDRFMTQPEIDLERKKYAAQMVQVSDQLDSTIHAILARQTSLGLDNSEQASFRALAEKLHEQVENLRAQAGQGQIDAIPATLNQITNTCTSCHALFRNLKP
jgi:soluble cytochrome b562